MTTLFLTSTATGSPFPTTSRTVSETANASEVTLGPGEFDSGFPGNTDAGQWNPSSPLGNTTAAAEIDNIGVVPGVTRQGWLWDQSLTGLQLPQGTVTLQLRLNAVQGTGLSGRLICRISVVRGVAGAWVTDANLLTTAITGETSHSVGQEGWRANEGARITVTSTSTNFSVTIASGTALAAHTFTADQRLLFEFGFCDANSTADRTWRLDFNTSNSFITIPTPVAPDLTVNPSSSSWIWSTQGPTVVLGDVTLSPASSSWVWDTQTPTIVLEGGEQIVTPGSASWLWTTQGTTISAGDVSVAPSETSWLWTTEGPLIAADAAVDPASSSWLWTTQTPTIVIEGGDLIVTPTSSSWLWASQDPSVTTGDTIVNPGSTSWLWTTQGSSVLAGDVVASPLATSWLWTTEAPSIATGDAMVSPSATAWLWTTEAPSIAAGDVSVSPAATSWLWTIEAPSIAAEATVFPAATSWIWSTQTPTIVLDGGEQIVTPSSSSWVWSTEVPTISAGDVVVSPLATSWLWTTQLVVPSVSPVPPNPPVPPAPTPSGYRTRGVGGGGGKAPPWTPPLLGPQQDLTIGDDDNIEAQDTGSDAPDELAFRLAERMSDFPHASVVIRMAWHARRTRRSR